MEVASPEGGRILAQLEGRRFRRVGSCCGSRRGRRRALENPFEPCARESAVQASRQDRREAFGRILRKGYMARWRGFGLGRLELDDGDACGEEDEGDPFLDGEGAAEEEDGKDGGCEELELRRHERQYDPACQKVKRAHLVGRLIRRGIQIRQCDVLRGNGQLRAFARQASGNSQGAYSAGRTASQAPQA